MGAPDYTRPMKSQRFVPLFLALFALSLLVGCGNKGDLVHPAPTPEAPATN